MSTRTRGKHAVRVHALTPIDARTLLIDLRPVERSARLWKRVTAPAALPPVEAGAHIDLHLDGLVRQYSLCNAPGETHRYVVCVQAEPEGRGGSVRIHRELAVGAEIAVSPPRNRFPLLPAPRTLLFAGGIGITPMLSMAEELTRDDAEFELHVFSSAERAASLRDYVLGSAFAARAQFHSGSRSERAFIAESVLAEPAAGERLYVCGPAGFMEATAEAARAAGWPAETIHQERFLPVDTATAPSDASFSVQLARDGRRFAVPAGATIARVLREGGVPVDVSCEQGMCGTCLTRVIAGVPDHRDVVQTDEEKATNTEITLCCSRSLTPELTLDL